MNLLKSVKSRFKSMPDAQREDLEGFNAPEYFGILTERARDLYAESPYFSISLLRERFSISYCTAAKVMDQLEKEGAFWGFKVSNSLGDLPGVIHIVVLSFRNTPSIMQSNQLT